LDGEPLTTTFADWWFLNGGSIHGLWKGKKFSEIRDLALSLPKMAWDARQPEVDGVTSERDNLQEQRDAHRACPHDSIIAVEAEVAQLRAALTLIAEYTNYPITVGIARTALDAKT